MTTRTAVRLQRDAPALPADLSAGDTATLIARIVHGDQGAYFEIMLA
jgi:hypothetical protein